MLVFVDKNLQPFADWSPIAAGWAWVPKRTLQLLVHGVLYDIPTELMGTRVSVRTTGGERVEALYVG